jgi:hypothetical protein
VQVVLMNEISIQEAFNLVKEFYDHAWYGLLAVVGLIGIVFPIIGYYNNKEYKDSLEKLIITYKKHEESIESLAIQSNIATGNIYLQQADMQIEHYSDNVLGIYLIFFKALNCFLDASSKEHVRKTCDRIKNISETCPLPKDLKCYPDLASMRGQVIKKLKAKKCINNTYSKAISFLNNLPDSVPKDSVRENKPKDKAIATTDNK